MADNVIDLAPTFLQRRAALFVERYLQGADREGTTYLIQSVPEEHRPGMSRALQQEFHNKGLKVKTLTIEGKDYLNT